MGLKGRLEDLPLLDMLQIVAFSKKSGYLRIAAAKGRGAVVLKEGRVLFSYSWSTLAGLEELVRHPERITPAIIRKQIEASLRELGSLREGHFQFELADPSAEDFGGIKIQPFLLPEGLDAQELLLDLAVEIDNERRVATSLLELAFEGDIPPEPPEATVELDAREAMAAPPAPLPESPAAPAAPAPPLTSPVARPEPLARNDAGTAGRGKPVLVLVDDEKPVREVVGEELEKRGYRVFTASNPAAGVNVVRERTETGERVVVVVDLKMPTSSERSFFGGFELIRRVHRRDPSIPVVLMTESISDKAKARAKELGIRRLAYKPTLSKIDPELYVEDLREFAAAIERELQKIEAEPSAAARTNGSGRERGESDSERIEFLSAMTRKLVEPGGSTDVSRLVLLVAARFLERGVLFVVKGDTARGLAAFGIARTDQESTEAAQNIAIEIGSSPALSEPVRRGSAYRAVDDLFSLEGTLFAAIGRGRANEAVLIPLLYNRATLLLLYGDNGRSGSAVADLGELELFMAQAGMALENKLLQRKLSAVDSQTEGGTGLGARV